MKHLYAGLAVGAIVAALITAAILGWWFLSLFVSRELATVIIGVIVVVIVGSMIIDIVTERGA